MDIRDLEDKAADCTARLDLHGALGYLQAASSLAADLPVLAGLLDRIADLLIGMGRDDEAWDTLTQALEIRTREGDDAPHGLVKTLDRMVELGIRLKDKRGLDALDRLHAHQAADKGTHHMVTVSTVYRQGIFLQELGDYTRAEEVLREVADMRERALGARNPLSAATRFSLAQVCAIQGKLAEAAALAEQAVGVQAELLGDGHAVTRATQSFIEQVRAAMALAPPTDEAPQPPPPTTQPQQPSPPQQESLADAKVDAAVVEVPSLTESATALNPRGIEHAQRGRDDAALTYFVRAAMLDPTNIAARCNQVVLFLRQNREEDVRLALEQALAVAPDRVMLHVQSALLHYRQGQLNPAFLDIGSAVMADLRNGDAPPPLVDRIGKGLTLLREGRFEDGWWALEETTRDFSGQPHLVLVHAIATHLMGNTKRAVVDLDDPDPTLGSVLPLILLARVLLFEESQWVEDAAEELEAARDVAPHLFEPDFEA